MFSLSNKGSFDKTEAWLKRVQNLKIAAVMNNAGARGVAALAANTPRESSETAGLWDFHVESGGGKHSISWTNSHDAGGVPLVILLQLGHGTGTGGYVKGRDFINPPMQAIFDKIESDIRKAVNSA